MSRTIQDTDLLLWEAYSTVGDFGFPDRSKIVFHCLSDRTRRARFIEREVDKSGTEKEIVRLSDADLVGLLEQGMEVK